MQVFTKFFRKIAKTNPTYYLTFWRAEYELEGVKSSRGQDSFKSMIYSQKSFRLLVN